MIRRKKKKNDGENNSPRELPTVTVAIPAFNEIKSIADTVKSIQDQTYSKIIQILVIDDSSTDGTGDIARECGVEVIRTPKNTGTKSQALNFAFPYLKGELTAIIDADTMLESKAIEAMAERFVEEPYASACSCVFPQIRKSIWQWTRVIEYLYGFWMRKKTQAYLGALMVSSGCATIFDTKILLEYGYSEGTMVEDMELTWRLVIAGEKVKFFSDIVAFSKDPDTWTKYKQQMRRWLQGYFQTISIHKKDIWKNKKLAMFVLWYTTEGLAGLVIYALLIWSIIFPPAGNLVIALSGNYLVFPVKFVMPLMYLSGFALIVVGALYQANQLRVSKKDVFKGILPYFFVNAINCVLFLAAFLNEWVLKRKPNTWEKGH